ncbi:MAG: peptidoglycan-binding protein [Magnetospirillum sp.]
MTILPLDPRQRRPGFPFQDDFFTLGAPVGPDQSNRREDVIRVETILGNTGHHDLSRTDGPVGYWGQRQEQAVKDWQSQNGLKVDGLLKPGGPTITSLKQAAGGLLGGFTPPSPDEVDQHQSQRMQGEPGILNTRPARLSFTRPDQPLDLDEQSQAFNADSARALTHSSVNGDIPRIYGDFAKQARADAHATLMDLAEQMDAQVGRDRTDQVMHGIVSQLPPDQAKALLGGTMPAARPLGGRSADLPDDSAVPLFRAAAAPVGNPPSSPSESGPAKAQPETPPTPTPTPTSPAPTTEAPPPPSQPSAPASPVDAKPEQNAGAQRPQTDTEQLFGMPLPNEDDAAQETRKTLERARDLGKLVHHDKAAALLDHYLDGDGSPVTLDKDWVRGHEPVKQAEQRVQGHFENWLTGKGPKDTELNTIERHIPKDGETREIKGLTWQAVADGNSAKVWDERNNALGAVTVNGIGNLKLERQGDEVIITGTVQQNAKDRYDFGKGKDKEDGWLPQGMAGGDPGLHRQDIVALEKRGQVKPFDIQSDSWEKQVVGRLKLDAQGRIIGSQFEWRE